MIILALSTVRGVSFGDAGRVLGLPFAVAVTIALQLWRRSAVLSIVAGTATYVLNAHRARLPVSLPAWEAGCSAGYQPSSSRRSSSMPK